MKDPLETGRGAGSSRPRYWIALFVARARRSPRSLFPSAVAIVARDPRAADHHLPARARALRHRQAFGHEGDRVLRRLRAAHVVGAEGRDRVRPQGDPARRLLQDHRDDQPRRGSARGRAPRRTGRSGTCPKVVVASAGSAMHFALAFVLMFGVLAFAGDYPDAAYTTKLDVRRVPVRPPPRPGLHAGDKLVAVDGEPLDAVGRPAADARSTAAATPITFTVERDGDEIEIPRHARDDRQSRRRPTTPKRRRTSAARASRRRSTCRRSSSAEAFVEAPRQVWDLGARVASARSANGSRRRASATTGTCSRPTTSDDERPTKPTRRAVPLDRRLRPAGGAGHAVGLGRGRVPADRDQRVRRHVQPACRCCRSTAATSRSRPTRRSRRRSGAGRCGSTSPSCCRSRRVVMAVLAFIFLSSLFLDITRPARQPVLTWRRDWHCLISAA